MSARPTCVAGQFYPAEARPCEREARRCLTARPAVAVAGTPIAAIVPHAGWICSGSVAGQALIALCQRPGLQTVVLFGAVHRRRATQGAIYTGPAWSSPLGEVAVDVELARAMLADSPDLTDDPDAHADEHSIEVQVPLIQRANPAVRLVPVLVPPSPSAPAIGRAVAASAARIGRCVVFVGSTDLTHYGPRYGFTPHGSGPEGLHWAHDVNDRRMIELCLAMADDRVVDEALTHWNACGSGAIAATLAAARVDGASRAQLCCHTSSAEVLAPRYGEMDDAVGYAGILFSRPEDLPD